MAKKQDMFYFDNFCTCADFSCQAACLLDRTMREFNPAQIKEKLDEMHTVEHAADEKKHEMLHILAKAFITPDRKSTRLNSSHRSLSRMPSSA